MGGSFSTEIPGGGTEGYHVLRVQEGSPGHKAGLEAFFDFIVAIGHTRLNQDNDTLKDLLKANIEKPVKMAVYSSKTQSVREVTILPSHNWGGQGLLGVSIRFCSFEGANENVWHVLEVKPNSPADLAGLKSNTDYIIGADSVLHESEDLFTLIDSHEGKPLRLYIYNTETDSCREVTITPNGAWGGDGSLGCGIGYGYLHRIPKRQFPSSVSPEKLATTVQTPQKSPDGFAEVSLGNSPAGLPVSMAQMSINTGTPTIPVIPTADNGAGRGQPLQPAPMPNFSSPLGGVGLPGTTMPNLAGIPNLAGMPNLSTLPPFTMPMSLPGMQPAGALPAMSSLPVSMTQSVPGMMPSSTVLPPGIGSAAPPSVMLSPGAGLPMPSMPAPAPLPNLPTNFTLPTQAVGDTAPVPQSMGSTLPVQTGAAGDLNAAAANMSASAVSPVVAPVAESSEMVNAAS
ncbi:Golgi reassembly-stacking protein 2-like isoform X2 [Pecten maximus]|uniref:Golgi reassembly-stacking protein 2-like isoform X2 n=1 Tax=Pecten maximus TaxID=6579 RepID=UPI0014590ED6|nr:Golgi reassembly-stacking protein 2-like isoform X2 [Pecten maximus]